jgi:hypothetical protein
MTTKTNLVIYQGATIHFEIQLFDANGEILTDTSGYSAASQIRPSMESNSAFAFTTSFTPQSGVLNLDMTKEFSNTIPYGSYVYDVMLFNGNTAVKLMEGLVTVQGLVTR